MGTGYLRRSEASETTRVDVCEARDETVRAIERCETAADLAANADLDARREHFADRIEAIEGADGTADPPTSVKSDRPSTD